MTKAALICYHKNLDTVYPAAWIDEYRISILNQTNRHFDIFELNYGGGQQRIFEESTFISYNFPTFVDGMNYMLDSLFARNSTKGTPYDCVFNTNVDDYYDLYRVEKQLVYIRQGYDIVSSNLVIVREGQEMERTDFHLHNTWEQLSNDHNVITHPSVVYSKNFWLKSSRYRPDEIPFEDLKLWQRSINDFRFIIVPDHLLFYRLHNNSVCQNPLNR